MPASACMCVCVCACVRVCVSACACAVWSVTSSLLPGQEQERRRKAERAAHAAMNGPKAVAYEYAGPDYEVGGALACSEQPSLHLELG